MSGYYPSVVTSEEQLASLVAAYSKFSEFAFDTETVGSRPSRKKGAKFGDVPALDERTNEVIWLGLAGPGRVDAIPLGHPGPPQLRRSVVLEALRPLFFSDRCKINQNVKFDILSLAKYWGAVPPGPFLDTLTLVHLLNENLGDYGLGALVERYLDFTYDKLARKGVAMNELPFWDVALYAGLDAKLAYLLYQRVWKRLEVRPALLAVEHLEMDVTEVLIWAQERGVLVARDRLDELNTSLLAEITALEDDIYRAAGRKFLITSTQQRAELLFGAKEEGNLGLPARVLTPKGARSTNEKALRAVTNRHPVVPMLIRHADLSKLRGTYTEGLTPWIDDDGRIRAGFKQSGTVTGRFSCSRPNLQNIPRQAESDDEGARVRSMFIAAPGYVLVVGDYSQIELRFLAHYAGPMVRGSKLLQAFRDGIDLHLMTASGLYSKALNEVSKEERQDGKTANFLLSFGGGIGRLEESGYKHSVAKRIYEGFHGTYPEISLFSAATVATCRSMDTPYVETILGRRRRLPGINGARSYERGYHERQAVNHVIQGSAADVNKMAMVRAQRRIVRYKDLRSWRVLLSVHDEIMLEVPETQAAEGIELLTEAMEKVKVTLRVPLVADVHAGPTWASAK